MVNGVRIGLTIQIVAVETLMVQEDSPGAIQRMAWRTVTLISVVRFF